MPIFSLALERKCYLNAQTDHDITCLIWRKLRFLYKRTLYWILSLSRRRRLDLDTKDQLLEKR
jgi:hypothetical protein